MFIEHSIFSERLLRKAMKPETKYLAIVREPLSQLRSRFKFFHTDKKLGLSKEPDPVKTFLYNFEKYKNMKVNPFTRQFGFNEQTLDMPPYLQYLDTQFEVVATLDRLDESLVLIKRRLCWSFKDILYLPTRTSRYRYTANDTDELKQIHRNVSNLDYQIYDYLSLRLQQQIEAESNDMQREVAMFVKIADETKVFCTQLCDSLGKAIASSASHEIVRSILSRAIMFKATQWGDKFEVSGLDCIMMMFDPDVYRNAQRIRQYPEICEDGGGVDSVAVDREYCHEYFAFNYPFDILRKTKTFLFKCN